MKTKRFLLGTFILYLAMTLFFVIPAFAASTLHRHPSASFSTPINSADGITSADSVYLTSDVTLTSDISIDNPLSICLNGFNLYMGSYTITVCENASLTIEDCSVNPNGQYIIGPGDKPAFEVFGELDVSGGNFVSEGRSVIFNRAVTKISDGSITGTDAQLVQTSGSAYMIVSGGEIKASGTGSAIAMVAAPEDETAKKLDYNVAIGGGVITAEAGSPGTVVINAPKGRFVINTRSKIVGNACPAIRVEAGNFDAYGGAVVYSDTASAIVGVGGNINLYFATITSEEVYGVDISENAELLLSGSLEIVGGNAGIRLAEGKVFSMSDYGFYGDVRVSVYTDEIPTADKPVAISAPCGAKHYSHFLSATPSSSITYIDSVIYNTYDGTVAHSHDNRNYVIPLHGGYSDLVKNNYYLENDLTCNGFFTGSVVNICLNGHTLNLGTAIKIYPNSTLNIYDCQGTGKIQCNSTCIQDINNGNARVIVHQGTIVSNSAAPIKLTGDDTVIVKGGKIMSSLEGSTAIEATGFNNSVIVEGGSIEGVASAIKVQDGGVTFSGTPEGTFKGNFIVQNVGFREGLVTVDGNPNCDSHTADIFLASGKLLAAGGQIDPGAKFTVVSESVGDVISLSAPSENDISGYFESPDETKALMSGDENVLQLVRRIPASPESAEIITGESTDFKVNYTAGGTPAYQWHMRNLDSGESIDLKTANSESFSTPTDLKSGSYELYCVVRDESGTFVGDRLKLSIKNDVIENVSVSVISEVTYTGEPVNPEVNSSASTTYGRSVSFTYSLDGINYSESIPLVGPDVGQYTIYYTASSEGCEDVEGQFSLEIKEAEQAELPTVSEPVVLSPRLNAIIVSSVILLVLCVIFIIQLIRKKNDE